MLRLALPSTRAVAPLFSRSFGSTLQRLNEAPKAGSKVPKKAEAPAPAAAPAAAAAKGNFEFPEEAVFGAPARYVKGLFELAQKNGHLDELRAELNKVAQLAKSDVSFRDGLKRGNIDAGYSDYVNILLSELKARQKTKLFNQIVEGFENACRDVYNEVHITVTVPNALPKNEIEKIAQEFCENYVKNSCKLVMTVDVDPSILGGRVYQIDDIIVDLSEKLIVDGWIAKKAEEQARLLDAQKVGTVNEVPFVTVPSKDAATKAAAADYAGYSFRLPTKSAH